jgi:hypothetical protein
MAIVPELFGVLASSDEIAPDGTCTTYCCFSKSSDNIVHGSVC